MRYFGIFSELLLRTSKVVNTAQRKVHDYNLEGYQMVTSGFSSSSCTLGPNVSFQFTVHCDKQSHSFAAPNEQTMLSWVAALKQVLTPASTTDGKLSFIWLIAADRQYSLESIQLLMTCCALPAKQHH